MSDHDRMTEERLAAALSELAGPSTPGFRNDILAATSRTRQRPAWSYPERWLPMAVITRPAVAPGLRPLWLLLIAWLIVALAVGGAIVGGALLRGEATIPMGGDAVLAFDAMDGEIYTIKADGTDLRRLTDAPGTASIPAWSPDGTRIAYLYSDPGNTSIVVMDAGGANQVTVATLSTTSPFCIFDASIAWSPDGKTLIVPDRDACGPIDLLVMPSDGKAPPARLLAAGLQALSASWSPDGRRIAFQGMDDATGVTGLYVIELGDSDPLTGGFSPRRIADGPGPKLDQAYSVPAWSPDGTEIAAVVGPQEACYGDYTAMTWDLVAVDVDTGAQRSLAAEPGDEMSPAWSADGEHIAFHRTVDPAEYYNDRPCTVRTWVADRDGANARELPALENNAPAPLWSPDGTRLLGSLVESEIPGDFQLSIIPVDDGGEVVRLPGASGSASWQPKAVPLPPAPSFAS